MARNKVFVDIVVDDKGSTKRIALDQQALAAGMEKAAVSSRSYDRNLKGAAATSANATKNNAKMMQGISGGLVPAYATLAANVFALTAAFNFFKRAADVANLQKSQVGFAQTTGTALASMTERLREASDGMLGFREAAAATAMGAAKGFSPKQMEDLAVGARKASAALGVGFEDAFDRLVRGASKAEPELLDELGITLRLETATKRYADAIGKNVKELTAAERSQAVLVETQRQLNDQFGEAEALSNPFVKLQKTFEDIIKQVTEAILPAFESFASFVAQNATVAATLFGLLAVSIIKTIPGVESLTEKFRNFGNITNFGIKDTINEWKNYKSELDKVILKQEQLAAAAKKKSYGIAGQMSKANPGKSAIIDKMGRGEELTNRDKTQLAKALKRAEKQYRKHGKIVSGIFKGEDIKRFKHFKESFEDMTRESLRAKDRMKNTWQGTKIIFKGVGKSIVAGVVLPFKAAAKAANIAGKAISAAMKVTMILGVATTILNMFTEMAKAPETVSKRIVAMLGGMVKGLEFALNMAVKMVNSTFSFFNSLLAGTKIGDFLGVEEGKPTVVEPFTFSEGFLKQLEDTRAKMSEEGGWAAIEETENDLRRLDERMESLMGNADTAAKDLAGIVEGLGREGLSGAQLGKQRAQGIGTLGVSDLIQEARMIAAADSRVTLEQALKDLGTKINADTLKNLSPVLAKALKEGDVSAALEVENLNRKYTASITSLKDQIDNLSDFSSKTVYQQLDVIRTMEDTATNAETLADELGYTADAWDDYVKSLEAYGGADVLKEVLETEMQVLEEQKRKLAEINRSKVENEKYPSQYAKWLNDRLDLEAKIVEQQRMQVQLGVLSRELADASEGRGKRTTDEILVDINSLTDKINLIDTQIDKLKRETSAWGKIANTAAESFEAGMISAFSNVIQGTQNIKEAFGNMAQAVLAALSQIIAKLIAMAIIEQGIAFFDFIGFGGKGTTQRPFRRGMMRYGGIAEPPSRRYGGFVEAPKYSMSEGGVARGRLSGYPVTMHGTEAVVPLPNKRSIPVDLRGSTGDINNVTVNVNMGQGGDSGGAESSMEGDNNDGLQLGKVIANAVQKELQNQKRSGGILNPYGVA